LWRALAQNIIQKLEQRQHEIGVPLVVLVDHHHPEARFRDQPEARRGVPPNDSDKFQCNGADSLLEHHREE
jgi:hypothetical protein